MQDANNRGDCVECGTFISKSEVYLVQYIG